MNEANKRYKKAKKLLIKSNKEKPVEQTKQERRNDQKS